MDAFSRDELKNLVASADEGLCVSIFMPTHRAGQEIQQDPIRLKNLLKKAEEGLVQEGLRAAEARELLEKVHPLLIDQFFWRHQDHGLAVFLSPKTFRRYRLPIAVEEKVVVNR